MRLFSFGLLNIHVDCQSAIETLAQLPNSHAPLMLFCSKDEGLVLWRGCSVSIASFAFHESDTKGVIKDCSNAHIFYDGDFL